MLKLSNAFLILLLLSGCSISIQTELPTPIEPIIVTVTLPSTNTPRLSETPLPPPPTPTVAPVQGTTSTQLNVRAEPSTASEVLGVIAPNQSVQIIGQDPSGNWWQILYETGVEGRGWVTAQYVETADKPEVPVIGGGVSNPGSGNSAVVIQQLNIRSGPGTSFNSLGILNANDVVTLMGKNREGTWLQIEFAGGPDGAGWVNAAFVKTDVLDALPIVSDLGEVVGTGTPMDTPLPPTPTIVPAPMDFDSADAPAISIVFARNGTDTLIYSGDVSSPNGDAEDWAAFTPYGNVVYVNIQCTGNNSLHIEFQGADAMPACNQQTEAVSVPAGLQTLVHISADSSSDPLHYTSYIVTIKSNP